ncbi:hypothetical protein A9Q84_14000 [Halobacteriovorax marinus]|uniref:ABC transmembrane type-1 domain-containing protein n=1 Tax=Halobacteriovorax marinus TaxID=97084 RepID=A0A1Y5F9F7_9BACT|nr:hypothetical protein A9Q84_14000 [Halobacteriovorax marinus]
MKYILIVFFLCSTIFAKELPTITVGSKPFTEGYITSEIIAQIIENVGEARVVRKFGLGGTGVVFSALENQEIDIYPEYTGTISEAILKQKNLKTISEIQKALEVKSMTTSESFGFNNTYALALKRDYSEFKHLVSMSDLKNFQTIKGGFSHEFLDRADGFRAMSNHYNIELKNKVSMQHALAYEALKNKQVELIEVYSTDAKIEKFNLRILKDDKNFFPKYLAVILTSKSFVKKYPKTWKVLTDKLVGKIDTREMIKLNALVELEGKTIKQAANYFLNIKSSGESFGIFKRIRPLLIEHLEMVAFSLIAATIFGIIAGVFASKFKFFAQFILLITGLFQTIPSLALLCFLIPLVGIGKPPAYVALFLYGLLPIVRNTYSGIQSIDPKLKEYSQILGMSSLEKIFHVELPLASRHIMSGIKTSAVINVGTTTLAAFIGAGGLGDLIVSGLTLNDHRVILMGAIPSALLALAIHYFFELLDLIVIPRGLRIGEK